MLTAFRIDRYIAIASYAADMLATAADIPYELHDLILFFFHVLEDTWRGYQWERNHVTLSKRELGQIALVCRHWSDLMQPKIFEKITLRHRVDVESLLPLVLNPTTRITKYIKHIQGSFSITIHPYSPWLHVISLRVLPRLHVESIKFNLSIEGPASSKQHITSIHGSVPRHFPWFSRGIEKLELSNLHFKQFEHFSRLLKELTSLERLKCRQVTWDISPDYQIPQVTSYLSRPAFSKVDYTAEGCTNDRLAAWLCWSLAPTRADVLEQRDAIRLYHITLALTQHVDSEKYPGFKVTSSRQQDHLSFRITCHGGDPTPRVYVYFTPRAVDTRRRVRAIALYFALNSLPLSEIISQIDWVAIDQEAVAFGTLVRFLLVFYTQDDSVAVLHRDVVNPLLTGLTLTDKIRYAVNKDLDEFYGWIQVTCRQDEILERGGNCTSLDAMGAERKEMKMPMIVSLLQKLEPAEADQATGRGRIFESFRPPTARTTAYRELDTCQDWFDTFGIEVEYVAVIRAFDGRFDETYVGVLRDHGAEYVLCGRRIIELPTQDHKVVF
ncbi:hypothetical protein NM688_g2117 [Phlebia brevispora]|uniref:Uncharacterized protein n=1 Tax=Phlebia brevispora TaxID=194682 RepID=A0ACC1T9R5_9APHY|nr:hypothetical protein NM688_g2117 [Phlebia brevispora]